jgi:hypothetical protein
MARIAAVPANLATQICLICLICLVGCSFEPEPDPDASPERAGPTATRTTSIPAPDSPSSSAPTRAPRADIDAVRPVTAMAAVRHLATDIGPRPGTSPEFHRAAGWVERRLSALGWQVRQRSFPTPAGVSWGVPVPAGRSVNVIATRGDVSPGRPWLAVGAHLDTVPRAPGAEDNASGVGVLLTIAEAVAGARTRLPVVLVAFGSEEPRGPGDNDHHYGSRAFVAELGPAQRRTLRGMVSLDRVGVGRVLPVSSARGPDALRAELLAAARRAEVQVVAESGNRASDHWSFVRAGLPGVRLGSTPYAGYHSAADVPAVVDRDQLERAARTVVAWLGGR